jgi:hypothetical protein
MPDALNAAPWSVAWSGEQAFRLQPSRDFPGMVEIDQKSAPGVGEPLFAAVHVSRQRRGIVDMLCHVCGKPTPRHDRYVFPVASGGLVTLHDGGQQYGCNVPPIHLACARRALAACPHLTKLADAPLKCDTDDSRVIQRTDVTPGLEALAAELASELPAGQEVVFSCYRLYSAAFTRAVVAAREAWDLAVLSRKGRA